MEKRETNEKAYYNAKLDRMMRKYITREQYGQFSIILREIFLRRSYEFNFSESQMENEVANFVKNVRNIGFVPKEEMPSHSAMGVYSASKSEIKINQDYYLSHVNAPEEIFGSKLFETLTHEVYHAITYTKSELGLMYVSNGKWVGSALNEVFTETAANRASHPRGAKEAEQYRADTDGYSDITFFTNLLAASIGVTEKEILQGGAQNRAQLMQVIASKFPAGNPYDEAQRLFQKMEASLDTVYNAIYKNQIQTDAERDVRDQVVAGALSTMYETAFQLASHQIENDTKEISSESLADICYRYSKMDRIMKDSSAVFENWRVISPESRKKIYINTAQSREALADQVIGFDTVVKQGYKITNPRDLERSKKLARKGWLPSHSYSLTKRYGVSIPKVTPQSVASITEDLEYNAFVMREDFDDGRQWNNRDVAIVIKRFFVEEMEKKGLIHKPSAAELQDTDKLPVVDPDKTEELPVVDIDKTEELPAVDGEEKQKGIFEKIRDSINIIITRFKNRNQQKLSQGLETREDNSEYYASLATQTLESSLDKYVVGPQPTLKVEDIQVGNEAKQNDKVQEDEER